MIMLWTALTSVASADSGCGKVVGDFAFAARTDAPTDAILVIDATYLPAATITDGPDAPLTLATDYLLACPQRPLVTISPPDGGWQPAESYTVGVDPLYHKDSSEPASLTFSTASTTADDPVAPTVISASAGAWLEEGKYPGGCCAPIREVTITVESTATDPWSYVQLSGDFGDRLTPVDVGFGPGVHELHYAQWYQDGMVQPEAFEVFHIASNGVASASERVELELGMPGETDTGEDSGGDGATPSGGGGCAAAPARPSLVLLLISLAALHRRYRAEPARPVPC